jgi:hypothetical protein
MQMASAITLATILIGDVFIVGMLGFGFTF